MAESKPKKELTEAEKYKKWKSKTNNTWQTTNVFFKNSECKIQRS